MIPSRLRSWLLSTLALFAAACGGSDGTGPGRIPDEATPPPNAPSQVVAFPQTPDRIAVSWVDNGSDETGFEVQRSLQAGSGFQTVGTAAADSTRFVDTGLSAGTTYYYRVRATGADEPSNFAATAQATTLPPRDPTSEFDCRREGYPCTWPEVDPDVFDESSRLGDEALLRFEAGDDVVAVADWIRDQSEVADVREGRAAIRFRLFGGRPTWVFGPGAIRRPDGAAPRPSPVAAGAPDRPSRAVVGDQPKSKRALVLAAYQFEFLDTDDAPLVAAILGGARGYEGRVDFFANTASEAQVGPAQFKGWGGYQAIHVTSHGAQTCEGGACETVIGTGPSGRDLILASSDGGVDLLKIDYGGEDAGVSTDFFREQYPEGLPDTIVFINACETAKGDDLARALAEAGGTYVGWSEPVTFEGAQRAGVAFYQELVEKGIPATDAYAALQEGATDLTVDVDDGSGAPVATLEVFQSGEDLRIREVAFLQNPLTKQDLPQEAPYPVVGTPEDGTPDRIPYLVKVDGVGGDPSGFTVTVTINGFSSDPRSLSEGDMVDGEGNVWQLKGTVDVPFDARQGQDVDVEVQVDLPEGGTSEWDESAQLGNPEIRFRSRIETVGGLDLVTRLESELEAEFKLAHSEDLERLEGEDVLRYTRFDVSLRGDTPCFISGTRATDGTLQVLDGDFQVDEDGVPVLPERIVIFVPPTIDETYTASCPEGPADFEIPHFFPIFYGFHGGQLCGGENEVDQAAGGLAIRNWTPGSGDVWARKVYDRSCGLDPDPVTLLESTTIELLRPGGGG